MRKEASNAIKILEEQLFSLEHIGSLNNGTWKTETLSQIENFFSKESIEYSYFKGLDLYVPDYNEGGKLTYEQRKDILSDKKLVAFVFINNCIRTIKRRNGIYKKPKPNLISNLSEGWLIAICGALITAYVTVYNIGYWYGQHDDKKTSPIIKLDPQNKPNDSTKNTSSGTKKK